MKFKKIYALMIFMLFSSSNMLMAFQTQKDTLSPEIVFESLSYNAGLVKPGDSVKGSFIIENKGKLDLEIITVTPG